MLKGWQLTSIIPGERQNHSKLLMIDKFRESDKHEEQSSHAVQQSVVKHHQLSSVMRCETK